MGGGRKTGLGSSTQHTAHSTQHAAQSTQHAAYSTQHTAHFTQHAAHSTLHAAQSTFHTARSTQPAATRGGRQVAWEAARATRKTLQQQFVLRLPGSSGTRALQHTSPAAHSAQPDDSDRPAGVGGLHGPSGQRATAPATPPPPIFWTQAQNNNWNTLEREQEGVRRL